MKRLSTKRRFLTGRRPSIRCGLCGEVLHSQDGHTLSWHNHESRTDEVVHLECLDRERSGRRRASALYWYMSTSSSDYFIQDHS